MRRPKGVVSFRLRPDPRRNEYYTVYIFKHKAAMQMYWQQVHRLIGLPLGGDFEARCVAYRSYDRRTRKAKPDIGQVLFYKGFIGAGAVSHELTHATTYWCKWNKARQRIFTSCRMEEQFATVQGRLVQGFWNRYYRYEERIKAL